MGEIIALVALLSVPTTLGFSYAIMRLVKKDPPDDPPPPTSPTRSARVIITQRSPPRLRR